MEIQTTVKSREIIKPSSPTPKSLQKHQLSFLDQLTPPTFMPFVYYYNPSNPKIPNSQISDHLKKSLSETLSTYYPLAGCLAGNSHVDCNDVGAPFSEAEANCNLSHVITDRNPRNSTKFLPYDKTNESPNLCLAVQVTYFRCGGAAVGILISHKIGDAFSLVSFVNSWSANARGSAAAPIPRFDAAAYFPPEDIPAFDMEMEEDVVARTLIFPAAKISLLREMYSGGGGQRRPSRVEALSVYLWTRLISATGVKPDPNKTYNILLAANLRTRMGDLPASEYLFGNLIGISMTAAAAGEGGAELLRKLRQANDGVYESYMDKLKESIKKRGSWLSESIAETNKSAVPINTCFSSLCGFPLYEADFGWGKPVWVQITALYDKNVIVFTNEKSGAGIEAWIHLSKQNMEKLEADLAIHEKSLLKISNL